MATTISRGAALVNDSEAVRRAGETVRKAGIRMMQSDYLAGDAELVDLAADCGWSKRTLRRHFADAGGGQREHGTGSILVRKRKSL